MTIYGTPIVNWLIDLTRLNRPNHFQRLIANHNRTILTRQKHSSLFDRMDVIAHLFFYYFNKKKKNNGNIRIKGFLYTL